LGKERVKERLGNITAIAKDFALHFGYAGSHGDTIIYISRP